MVFSRSICFFCIAVCCSELSAGYMINASGLSGGTRWDAANRTLGGNERSLQNGLRYSVGGGSYQAFRDQFSWQTTPSVSAFQQTVEQAFAAWTAPDPVRGIGTAVSFVPDFGTPVVSGGFGTVNQNGAEIDLIASNAGIGSLSGATAFTVFAVPVTLTSGTQNYADSSAFGGVDIHINSNAGAVYTLDAFRRILEHEIGHSIGLDDVDLGGPFIDDNYNSLLPAATLSNSWIDRINPLDPANSIGLSVYNIPSSVFGQPGVDLLMESNGLGVGESNPLSNLVALTNDEYAMRQFLYPTAVPEPGSIAMITLVSSGVALRFRRRRLARKPDRSAA